MWRQMGQRRAELAFVFDSLRESVLLYDADNTLVHANPSASRLFDGTPGASVYEVERLRTEAAQVARHINALMKHTGVGAPTVSPSFASREVRTSSGTVSIRGALAPAWMFGRHHGVIVTLERQADRAPSDAELRQHFGLTARELEVARWVAEGLSNQALAERLGVSFFTARNHVERVLTKVGAQNRAQVGAIIRDAKVAKHAA